MHPLHGWTRYVFNALDKAQSHVFNNLKYKREVKKIVYSKVMAVPTFLNTPALCDTRLCQFPPPFPYDLQCLLAPTLVLSPPPLQRPPQFETTLSILLAAVAAALTPKDDWTALAKHIFEHWAGEPYRVVATRGRILRDDVVAEVLVTAAFVKRGPFLRICIVAVVGGGTGIDEGGCAVVCVLAYSVFSEATASSTVLMFAGHTRSTSADSGDRAVCLSRPC